MIYLVKYYLSNNDTFERKITSIFGILVFLIIEYLLFDFVIKI